MNDDNAGFDQAARLMEEAQETLRAIRYGAVDAFVVEESEGHRVYALEAADLPLQRAGGKDAARRSHAGSAGLHRLLQFEPGGIAGRFSRKINWRVATGLYSYR